MSSNEMADTPVALVLRDALQQVLPRNGPKVLARIMGAPIGTVREWFYRSVSTDRAREIARELLREMDRQDARRAATRRQLQVIAGMGECANGSRRGAALGLPVRLHD